MIDCRLLLDGTYGHMLRWTRNGEHFVLKPRYRSFVIISFCFWQFTTVIEKSCIGGGAPVVAEILLLIQFFEICTFVLYTTTMTVGQFLVIQSLLARPHCTLTTYREPINYSIHTPLTSRRWEIYQMKRIILVILKNFHTTFTLSENCKKSVETKTNRFFVFTH